MPICIGGDDSVPIPILRAYEGRGPITILQVDAHLDYDTDREILRRASQGATNKEIGYAMERSEIAIKKRLQVIFVKLGASQSIMGALYKGLIVTGLLWSGAWRMDFNGKPGGRTELTGWPPGVTGWPC